MIPGAIAPRALLGALAAVLLAAAPASAETFGPTGAVPIESAASSSALPVSGLAGPITDVNVLLHDIDHARADDIDILVQSPTGSRLVLMSDACGAGALINGDLKFDQVATASLPAAGPCDDGLYDPTDHPPPDSWTVNPFYGSLDDFNGEVANGTWSIEVIDDDNAGQTGSVNGGWSLEIETSGTAAITISSGNQAFGPASPFPAELDVFGDDEVVVTDLDVLLDSVTHQRGEHIDMFLEGPAGQKAWLMSDVCPFDNKLVDWKIDDEAPNPFFDAESCNSNTYRPRNFDQGPMDQDTFASPAPAAPAGEVLSAFDLTDPDGTWRLWIQDDSEGGAGFIVDGWSLELDTRPAAPVGFAVGAQVAPEGSTVQVDVVRSAVAGGLGAGSVVVATSSGTAQAGADFAPVSHTLTFGPGETTKSIAVPVIADGGFEPEQDFSIALGLTEGDARVGTPAAVGVTIPADAQQPPPDIPTGNEDKPAPQPFTAANAVRSAPSARRCFKRDARILFRPQMPAGVAVLRSEVFVNGRKIEDNVGVSAVAPIALTMTGKRMRVRIRLHSHDGRVVTIRRTFRRCKTRRRS
ncbi:MAG TPA: Calx-beta domain-containing protein [Solirubrobacteraceae bacterium]|nr:Calx-beta domain-containing protein [Solirubrobacteraceae bacterium]